MTWVGFILGDEVGESNTAVESFDARPGNQIRLSTSFFLRIERTSWKLNSREKSITAEWVRTSNPQMSSYENIDEIDF